MLTSSPAPPGVRAPAGVIPRPRPSSEVRVGADGHGGARPADTGPTTPAPVPSLRLVRPPSDRMPRPEGIAVRRRIQVVACLALLSTLGYLVWRTAASLSGSTLWLAVPLLLLEAHALASLAMFTHDLWDVDVRPGTRRGRDQGAGGDARRRDDVDSLRVAVLIPTYDEPREILVPTIAAAVATRGPHDTWVLDDGDRPWVREVATALGARYRARRDGRHAKAGNINEALPDVDCDLVAVVDADHVVTAGFLQSLLPYFADPLVALVQTPQEFYNHSSFEHVERSDGSRFTDQELFYRAVLAGRNRWAAAFWCGTGAVVRVAALRSVGGVATDSVTEDIQTTLRLHRRGWRTVHHNEVLAHGLAADGPEAFFTQRNRWGAGAMQVLRCDNPLRGPGLTLHQRLSYLSTLLGWFDSWRTVGYVLLPAATLLSGGVPVAADWRTFLVAFAACFVLQRLALSALSRGRAPLLHATYFDFVRLPATFAATLHIVGTGPARFAVTPKGAADDRVRSQSPVLLTALLVVSAGAAVWYLATLAGRTPVTYQAPWVAHGAATWLVVNAGFLVAARHRIQHLEFAGNRRAAWRFAAALPVVARTADGRSVELTLTDMSISGARVELDDADAAVLGPGDRVTLDVPVGGDDGTALLSVPATIRSCAPVDGAPGRRWAGVLLDLSTAAQGRLALALYGTVDEEPSAPATGPRGLALAAEPAPPGRTIPRWVPEPV